MKLSAKQLESFRQQGFLNLGQVLTDEELDTIATEYDRLVTFDAQTLGNETDGVYPYRAMLNFRSAALRPFINHPEILEFVSQIIGPDVRFWWDQGINKAPGAGSVIPWHQDNGYHVGGCPEFLTTWLALDDSEVANGGLRVLPGSHQGGPREHALDTVHYYIDDLEVENATSLPARAGEHLIFSSLLIHETVGNTTRDQHRRSWVVQYGPADAQNLTTGEPYDDRQWVLQNGKRIEEPWAERRQSLR